LLNAYKTTAGSVFCGRSKNYFGILGIEKEEVTEVYMGNVLQTALGQNPARQAALYAGIIYKLSQKRREHQYFGHKRNKSKDIVEIFGEHQGIETLQNMPLLLTRVTNWR